MYQIPGRTERKNPLHDTQCSNPSFRGLSAQLNFHERSFQRLCALRSTTAKKPALLQAFIEGRHPLLG